MKFWGVIGVFFLGICGCSPSSPQGAERGKNESIVQERAVELESQKTATEPVRELPSCFESRRVLASGKFSPSSMMVTPWREGHVLATDSDSKVMLFYATDASFKTLKVLENAQTACLQGQENAVRLGVIERDAQTGVFALMLRLYDDIGTDFSKETWSATTRGFEPDAGSRCAILGRRAVLGSGIRPRPDKMPYRGLFRIERRGLTQLEGSSEETPEIMTWRGDQILTRRVVRDEGQSPRWMHIVYRVGADNTLDELLRSDFIVPVGDRWMALTRKGCVVDEAGERCPNVDIEVSRMVVIPGLCESALCMEWFSPHRAWMVRLEEGKSPQIVEIRRDYEVLPIRSGDAWIAVSLDASFPDTGRTIEYVAPTCLESL